MAIIGTADYRSMQEKRYTNGTKELIAEIARRLERQNIPFSGRINGNYGTITVSGDENKRIVDAMAESLKTSFTRQPRTERRIIGNTDFRYIPQKVITSVDPAIADTLENTLKANNIPYSGVVTNGDSRSVKITVSAENKPLLDRYADEAVRSIGVIAQLQESGYSFDTSKGISVSYNGETLHYDTVAAFMSAYQNIDNGFFHPADYKVIRSVNDEGQPVYTIAEYSKDTGAPKNNGNTEEFYSVSSVEQFIEENRNRINILTTADELQSFREMDMELMREQLISRNRELYSSVDSLSYVLRFNEDGTGTLVYTDLGDIVQLAFDENAVRMAYEFASEYTEDIFTDIQQQRARVSVWLDGLEEYADVKTISDDSEEYEAYINYIKGAESSGNKLYLLDDDRSDGISLVDEIEGHYPEVTARKILDGYLSMNEQERTAFVSERENRAWENTFSAEYLLYYTIRRDINSQNPSVDFETAMGMWENGIELKDVEGRVLTAEDGMPDILSSQIVHASTENKALYLGAVRFAHEIEDINESVVRTSPDSDLLDFMAQYAPDRYTGSFVISEEALEDYIKGNTAVYADWKEEVRELSLPEELKERIESLNIPRDDAPAVEEQTNAIQQQIKKLSDRIQELAKTGDWTEARNISRSIDELIDRGMAIKYPDKGITHSTLAAEAVDTLSESRNPRNNIRIGTTPQILMDLGCEQLPMLYTQQHLRDAIHEKDRNQKHHGLPLEIINRLPLILSNPVIVYDSLSRDDSIVIVTSEKDSDGYPIIAAVRPNGSGMYEVSEIDSNFLTSVHGRENLVNQITKAINDDKVLFADIDKSRELFTMQGLQLSEGFNRILSSNGIIHQSRNIVKRSDDIISANEQKNAPEAEKPGTASQNKAAYTIYQLPGGEKYHGIRFESSAQLAKEGIYLNEDDYDEVYSGEIANFKGGRSLEELFVQFNSADPNRLPDDFKGHSLSVSDVIEIETDGTSKAYFIDRAGFTEYPTFYMDKDLISLYAKPREERREAVAEYIADRMFVSDEIEELAYDMFLNGRENLSVSDNKDFERLIRDYRTHGDFNAEEFGKIVLSYATLYGNDLDVVIDNGTFQPTYRFDDRSRVKHISVTQKDNAFSVSIDNTYSGDLDYALVGNALFGTLQHEMADIIKRGWFEDKVQPDKYTIDFESQTITGMYYNDDGESIEEMTFGFELLEEALGEDDPYNYIMENCEKTVYSSEDDPIAFIYAAQSYDSLETDIKGIGREVIENLSRAVDEHNSRVDSLSEVERELGAVDRAYEFTVVSIDNGTETYVYDGHLSLDEVYEQEEFTEYLDSSGAADISVQIEQYSLGNGHIEMLEDEQLDYISDNRTAVTEAARLRKSDSATYRHGEERAVNEPAHDKQYYFEQAQKYINDFCDAEYDQTADFSNINEVGIAYTTITDEEIPLQINADLENYQIKYYLDNRLYKTEDYDSLQSMVEDALSVLDFNELIYTVEQDPEERIQAFVDVDTHINVPEQGISFDIKAIDEFIMEGTYSEYLGGMDENGHEAKDNFAQYDTSLSLRLEGAKVISEVYDERDMFAPYTEDIFDLLEDGDREKLISHITHFAEDNKINKVYTIKDGKETPLDLAVPSEGITIDGQDGTWSVINTMTYGGKELSLLENDELGDEVPYIIMDSDNKVLSDRAHSFEDFTSVYTESEVALGLVDKTISFTVAEFDDGTEIAVFDGRLNMDDIQKTNEYLDYADTTEFDDIRLHLEQYIIGAGLDPSNITDEQTAYIKSNLSAVKKDASMLESDSKTIQHEYHSDIVKDMGLQHSNITFEPEKEKFSITVAELSVGDMFRYKGSVYTVEEMSGIYPDDVAISKTKSMGGRDYIVKQNIDRFLLVREGEYLGNPNKVIAENEIPQLSAEDIAILRQLEPRKSVLNFTDDEIKLTGKWQERFTDIGEKSPYYRLQNGDWRESEDNTVPIISVQDRNADFRTVSEDIKNKAIFRGECRNLDTDWTIQVSRRGLEDSLTYARQHKDNAIYQMMYNVQDLIQNSVLLDTVVSEKNNNNKANNTAFMHKLYSVCRMEDEPYLAKISVEEFLNGDKDTLKRMYNVQDIKIEPLRHAAFTDKQLALSVLNGTEISISDLYAIVKTFDEDFYLNKRTSEKEIQEERTETKETETEQLDLFSMPPEKTEEEASEQAREEPTAQNEWHTVPDVSDDEGNPLEWAKKLDDGSFVWIDKEVYPDGTQFAVYNTSSHELPPLETFATLEMAQEYVDEELNRSQEKHDFTITSDDFNTTHGQKNRFRQNVEAIRTLKQIEGENRLATPEEQQILSGYVGWGGIPEAFDSTKENWQEEYSELKELLTDDEYAAARASVTNAHYTSPIVIEAMYTALQNMGFEGGKVLDPSMGTGNFEGKMPEEMREKSRITGVELDSLTGRMAKQLYQSADVQIKGFENTNFANNSFDVAISNVPFGNYKVFDKDYLKQNFAIHNYFFAKSLDKVHPGGIVAFVTSQYTMDSTDTKVREYLAQRAELLGAIRLPMGAFRDIAGTDVGTDIIFLQKRERPIKTNDTWIEKGQTEDGIPVNAYFAEHPEMVLGNLQIGKSMYGTDSIECVPIEGADLKEQLAGAIQNIQGEYRTAAKAHEESRKTEREAGRIPAPNDLKFNSYAVVNDKLYLYDSPDGMMREVTEKDLAKNLIPRAKDMTKLRDQTNALLELERDNVGGIYDDAVELEMEKLGKLYDDFVAKHGRLTDKQNIKAFERDSSLLLVRGLEKTDSNGEFAGKADVFTKQTIRGAVVADHVDNAYDAYVLSMNEKMHVDFDYMTKISGLSKDQLIADLGDKLYQDPAQNMEWVSADEYLTGNVRQKLREAKEAGLERNISALEKVQPEWIEAVNIDAKLGAPWIDEKYIKEFASDLLRVNYFDRQKLKVEYEPVTGEWKVERPSNLNFNAAEIYGLPKNSRYNAYALLQMTLNNQTATVKVDVLDEYGQPRFDDKGNKLRVIDKEQTDLARVKQDNLREAFAKWVFEDPERRRALTEKYNNTYNAVRLREFDGSNFNFVGMNSAVNLMPHQKNAILRSLSGGNTLLAHEVGAGKSFEMSAIAMEGKRLGLHNKALIVVPNTLTTQMGKEFSTLYPSARLLVATEKDFRKENRDALYAKIAFGDYDAIVMGHSQFDRVHLNSTTEERWLRKQIDDLRTYLNGMRAKGDGDRLSVKKIEGQVKTLEEKLKKLLDQSKNIKDDFIEFEKLGIDKLFIDESQAYKNRSVATKLSNVAGLGGQGAMRSELLAMKIAYLNEKGGTVTFASGTPISNSITELYTVMDYLEPDKLKEMNINSFDDWVRIFATPKTEMELKPTGNGQYQDKTRLKFSNLPELMTAFKEVADIKTAETLNLERPDAVEKTIVAEPSREQLKYIRDLGRRAEKIHKEGRKIDPKVDNMLKITSEGRKCGLDMRLLDANAKDDPNSKVNLCIDNVFRIWEDTSERNGTQLIFCDMSTPKEPPNENIYTVYRKGESSYQAMYSENTKQSVTVDAIYEKLTQKPSEEFFTETSGLQEGDIIVKRNVFPDEKKAYNTALIVENGQTRGLAPEEWEQLHLPPVEDYEHQKSFCVYDDLKEKLIAKGVPEEQIAFIHDAANPQEAQQLYEKMNKGEIRVMIGSSTKCGAGMNAQNKMVALHHLDAPFRPSDIGQRNGRIQRRGNENKEVEIYKYVTNRTFDAYIYQLLENKQKFISAVMTEKSPVRTCDDVDEVVLSFAETKACCAGNPDILRQVQLDREIKGLQTRLAEYQSSKYRMQDSIVSIPTHIQNEERVIEKINADIELAKNTPMEVYHRNEKTGREDKEYPLTIKGVKYSDRQSGAEALKTFIDRNITAIQSGYTVDIGEYRGFKLAMYADPLDNLMDTRQPKFILKGNSEHYCNISFDDRTSMNYAQLNRCIENMDREKEYHTERIAELKAELDGIQKKIDIPFEHQQELDTLQAELKEVNERLRRSADASDINSGFIYEWLVEMCPEICSGEDIYVKYEAADPDSRWTEESGGLEPVFIETAGNQLMLGQTYKQNGDLMYDPLITMELNHESKTVKLLSYENSGLGKYEKFVSEVEGIDEKGNTVMNIKENKQGMESCGDFICDTMMPNIQAFNYTRITPEPKGSLAAPEQVKRKAI